jgi:ribonuclease T
MTDYISVDVESSGPIHGYHNLLEIGAVDCDTPSHTFQIYVKPTTDNWSDSAKMVNKSQQFYVDHGISEYTSMLRFKLWLEKFNKPVFVGFNAPFDYGWINYEFHKMCGENPFGINALDIKAYYMGKFNCDWRETTKNKMNIKSVYPHTHNALDDAIEQADIFNQLRRIV